MYLADSVYLQGNGQTPAQSFSEMMINTQTKKDDRTGTEIAVDIMKKFGLRFKQGG